MAVSTDLSWEQPLNTPPPSNVRQVGTPQAPAALTGGIQGPLSLHNNANLFNCLSLPSLSIMCLKCFGSLVNRDFQTFLDGNLWLRNLFDIETGNKYSEMKVSQNNPFPLLRKTELLAEHLEEGGGLPLGHSIAWDQLTLQIRQILSRATWKTTSWQMVAPSSDLKETLIQEQRML